MGFFCTCAVQLQAASPQTRPVSTEGQRQPGAPVVQPKPAPAPQARPQPRPQPVARPNPQPQPGASPITQSRPAPNRVQNVSGAPAPSQNGRFPQANTVRNGQAPSQFQQANSLASPTRQAENAGDPNAVARFFVKWGIFYAISTPIFTFLAWNNNDADFYVFVEVPLIFELLTMAIYYLGEGVNYLIFGPLVPVQAATQPAPMPQIPMGPPLGPRPMGR